MRSPSEGSVTAEVAIVLPAVVAIVGVLFQVIATLTLQLSMTSLAAQAARDLSRGVDQDAVLSALTQSQDKVHATVIHNSQDVCVSVNHDLGWPVSVVINRLTVSECSLYAQ